MDLHSLNSSEIRTPDEILKFGPYVLNVSRRELRVPLSRRPMELLTHLVRNPGRLFTADELMMQVWREAKSDRSSLWHQVANVRKALRDSAKPHDYIDSRREGTVEFVGSVIRVTSIEPPDELDGIITL